MRKETARGTPNNAQRMPERFGTGQGAGDDVHRTQRRLVCGERSSTGCMPGESLTAGCLQHQPLSKGSSLIQGLSSLTLVEGAQCHRTSTGQRWTPSPARHQRAIAPRSCSSHKLHALGQDRRRAAVDGPSSLSFHRAPVPVWAAAVVKWSGKETAVTTHTSFLVSRKPPAKGCPERGTHSLASDSRAL